MSLTTHVLDTARGCGAAGMRVMARRDEVLLADVVLDAGGRATLLEQLEADTYEILFDAGSYHAGGGLFGIIPVRFIVRDRAAHHHIPLILAPFGYSTYRGG